MSCCICGNDNNEILWCDVCKHYFCGGCRWRYFHRGLAAVREWILKSPPKHCNHRE